MCYAVKKVNINRRNQRDPERSSRRLGEYITSFKEIGQEFTRYSAAHYEGKRTNCQRLGRRAKPSLREPQQ